MKRLLKIVGGLFLLVLVLAGLVVFTETGLSATTWVARKLAPDTVRSVTVHGRLSSPLTIKDLKLSLPQFTLEVDSLSLQWHPRALFKRTLKVDALVVEGIRYTALETTETAPPETTPITLPESVSLPVNVDIGVLELSDISLVPAPDASAIQIENIRVKGAHQRHGSSQLAVNVASDLVDLQGDLTISTQDDFPLSGQFVWNSTISSYAPVHGTTTLSGNLRQLQVDQMLDPPYALNATVVLDDPVEDLSVVASVAFDIPDLFDISEELPPYGVSGTAAFTGTPDNGRTQVAVVTSGVVPQPIEALLDATIVNKLVTLEKLNASINGQPVQLDASGTIDLSTPEPFSNIRVLWKDFAWPLDQAPTITSQKGDVKITGSPTKLLAKVTASVGDVGQVAGTVTRVNNLFGVDVHLDSIHWPDDGSRVQALDGTVKAVGEFDNYNVTLSLEADTPEVQDVTVHVDARGNQQSLDVTELMLNVADGHIGGNATVKWAPVIEFQATINGEGFNPAVFSTDWPGNLNVSLNADGRVKDDGLHATISSLELDGNLRKHPVMMSVKATAAGQQINLEKLVFTTDGTELNASGVIEDELALTWSMQSQDLSVLWPTASGAINSQGSVQGTRSTPAVKASLTGTNLTFNDASVNSVQVTADVDTAAEGALNVDLIVRDARAGTSVLSQATLSTKGAMDAHDVALSARSNTGDLDLQLAGSLDQDLWSFQLENLTVAYPELAPWSLQSPTTGSVGADVQSIDTTCLESGKSTLCVDARHEKEDLFARYDLQAFPIDYFKAFIPEPLDAAGVIDSRGEFTQKAGQAPELQVEMAMKDIVLNTIGAEDQRVNVVTMKPSYVQGTLTGQGLEATSLLDLGAQGKVELEARVAGPADTMMTNPLDGQLSLNIQNIGFISELVPDLERVSGALNGDLKLAGNLQSVETVGKITFEDGAVSVLPAGLDIRNINASVEAIQGNQFTLNLAAESGKGQLNVVSDVNLAAGQRKIELGIEGQDFEISNTTDAHVLISPDLTLQLNNDVVQFDGLIVIPEASITPTELPPSVVQVSKDQIIVENEETATDALPIKVQGSATVELGDNVNIEAFGLKTQLSGELTVVEKIGSETTGTGQLNINDGSFKAYGQDLEILNGRIIFAGGPLSRPGFDLEAVRRITSEVSVGVKASGSLASPDFSLFSEPAMSESERLSYLVLGRSLDDSSSSESSAMRKAAMALSVAGGSMLTEKFGDKLGVDTIEIDSELRETGEQASLKVGKYLTPKLFVSYGLGLFEPVSTLSLNYFITKKLKLVTETTESKSGGDLVYTFERGE